MQRIAWVVVLVSFAAFARPQLDAKQKQAYTTKLREGRKLVDGKQYAAAIAAFEAALAANPDEPTALAELGLVAYLAGDLAKAETVTKKAIAATTIPWVKAAALYNLGLVREAKKDATGAAAAYGESYRLRANAIVRGKLEKLDPKQLAEVEWWKPVALAGPFASPEAFCKTLPPDEDGQTCTCTSEPVKTTLAAPYLGLVVATHDCPAGGGSSNGTGGIFYLVHVAAGWFASEEHGYGYNLWCMPHFELASTKLEQLVPGDTAELALAFSDEESCPGRNPILTTHESKSVAYVGIGVSGKPSVVGPIELVSKETTEWDAAYGDDATKKTPKSVTVERSLSPKWTAGKLSILGKGGNYPAHAIVFP